MIVTAYLAWNIVAAIKMLIDKHRAKKGQWRISERTFLFIAFMFGAVGIGAGMYLFRHKTRHLSFAIGIPILLGLNIAILYWISGFG